MTVRHLQASLQPQRGGPRRSGAEVPRQLLPTQVSVAVYATPSASAACGSPRGRALTPGRGRPRNDVKDICPSSRRLCRRLPRRSPGHECRASLGEGRPAEAPSAPRAARERVRAERRRRRARATQHKRKRGLDENALKMRFEMRDRTGDPRLKSGAPGRRRSPKTHWPVTPLTAWPSASCSASITWSEVSRWVSLWMITTARCLV